MCRMMNCHITHARNSKAYFGTCIVENARLWLVSLDRGHIDDGAALLHMLYCMLRNGEVGENIGVKCMLQALPADLLKLVYLPVLQGSIVD